MSELGKSRRSRLPAAFGRAAAALAVYEGAVQAYDRAKSLWREQLSYTVTIKSREAIYVDVHTWLLATLPEERQRALSVTSPDSHHHPLDDDEPVRERPLKVLFDDERARRLDIDGHRVLVQLRRTEVTDKYRGDSPDKIVFTCYNQAGQRAVLAAIERLHAARRTDRTPVLRMVDKWDQWRTRNDLPPRALASVAIPDEQKTRVVEDLRTFLAAEDQYNRLAIPWHRGYLLHGPPGSGKTSLVKALASEFGLDLWYVSLSDLKAESGLMALLAEVSPRSLLLLEDIDAIRISHSRDTEQGVISTSSLLNALDGVATPHGLVTIMTTNHIEALDPALTRAGRMDVVEELGLPRWREVQALFDHYYGTPGQQLGRWNMDDQAPFSMAAVAEVFKRNLSDPDTAMFELCMIDVETPR